MKVYVTKSGKEIEMELTMSKLLKLKSTNHSLYKKVNKILMYGPKDLEDNVDVLYAAHVCASENPVSREAFIEDMRDELAYNNKILASLIKPKKN